MTATILSFRGASLPVPIPDPEPELPEVEAAECELPRPTWPPSPVAAEDLVHPLPAHSCIMDPEAFEYFRELIRRGRGPDRNRRQTIAGDVCMANFYSYDYPPFFTAMGVTRRCYVDAGAPKAEKIFTREANAAAIINFGKLARGALSESDEAKILAELEHLISFIPREQTRSSRWPRERAIHRYFEAWKKSRPKGGGGAR